MTYFGRTSADHAGVGSELAGRVQIARPIPRRTDDPELRVDRMAVVDDGEHDARGAGHPVRSLLTAGTGVCADSVAGEDVGGQASSVGEPASGGDPLRAPETCSAVVDIAVEALRIGTACGWQGSRLRRSALRPLLVELGAVPGALCEEVEGVSRCASAHSEHQVDRSSAVTAAVASPPLLSAATVEDRHGRGASGLCVLVAGTWPHRRAPRALPGTEEIVGECP
jgi:hypothetical protein